MNETGSHSTRVAIVGTGHVVANFASSLLLRWLAAEIVLIDEIRAKAEGDAMNLNHAVSFAHPTRVRAGDYSDCSGAIVTVMAASTAQKPGETRLDLLKNNAAIFRQIGWRVTTGSAMSASACRQLSIAVGSSECPGWN